LNRIKLENAAGIFDFNKSRNTQKLIHQWKYVEEKMCTFPLANNWLTQ